MVRSYEQKVEWMDGDISLRLLLSPSGDLGIGLVWDNRTTGPQLFEILFKLN